MASTQASTTQGLVLLPSNQGGSNLRQFASLSLIHSYSASINCSPNLDASTLDVGIVGTVAARGIVATGAFTGVAGTIAVRLLRPCLTYSLQKLTLFLVTSIEVANCSRKSCSTLRPTYFDSTGGVGVACIGAQRLGGILITCNKTNVSYTLKYNSHN